MCKVIHLYIMIRASKCKFGTYHIGKQLRLRRDCAYVQSRQSLCCLHMQSKEKEEGSDHNLDCYPLWGLKAILRSYDKFQNLVCWSISCLKNESLVPSAGKLVIIVVKYIVA